MTADPNPPLEVRLIDIAATALVVVLLVAAVLYPENYMPDTLKLGSQRLLPLTLLMPLVIVMAAAYLWRTRTALRPGLVDGLLLAYSVYFIARNITGPFAGATLKYALLGLGIFYLLTLISRKGELLEVIGITMMALVCLTAVLGLLEYAVGRNITYSAFLADTVPEPASGVHRSGSTLAHPVAYGAFLVQMLPFCLMFWLSGARKNTRILGCVSSVLAVTAAFFTFTKGSWFTVGLILLVAAFFLLRRRGVKGVYPVLALVLVALAVTAAFWQETSSETSERMFGSVNMRIEGWKGAYSGIMDNFMFGVGLRQGRQELLKYCEFCRKFHEDIGRVKPVDNNYFNLFLEQGVIGFLLWLALIAALFVEGTRALKARAGPVSKPWMIASIASLAGILINAVTFDAMLIWPIFVIFWIVTGILHGLVWRSGAVEV